VSRTKMAAGFEHVPSEPPCDRPLFPLPGFSVAPRYADSSRARTIYTPVSRVDAPKASGTSEIWRRPSNRRRVGERDLALCSGERIMRTTSEQATPKTGNRSSC
jgi:hypothetical protein